MAPGQMIFLRSERKKRERKKKVHLQFTRDLYFRGNEKEVASFDISPWLPSALQTMWYLLKEVVYLRGLPVQIVLDSGPRFTTKFWRRLQKRLGVQLLLTMAYHPQASR